MIALALKFYIFHRTVWYGVGGMGYGGMGFQTAMVELPLILKGG